MMDPGLPDSPDRDPGALLRVHGLRVTPQRRAILGAFGGGPTEHLSADEVHARASAAVPELSRGTVYAALAELTELGLLAAVGSPEPVRYEANARDHEHFRCRLCLRLYDIELPAVTTDRIAALGHAVERTTTTVEGVCAECVDYDAGLTEGARRSRATPDGDGAGAHALPASLVSTAVSTPLGPILLAATAAGLVRAVFEDHADAAALRAMATRRRGGAAARAHLAAGAAAVEAYFADAPAPSPASCVVDWDAIESVSVPTLQAVQAIGPGQDRSYETLPVTAGAHDRGLALGTNPLVIVVPCHRVTRGRVAPEAYVGGAERKRWLRRHERA
jgi:Fe2+ or Zn2+ uptake regulation protein/O6-methylguanine-DNA--protein-cysteine methyltransferase